MGHDHDHEAARLIVYCPQCEDKQECHADGEYVYQEDEVFIHTLVHCSKCCGAMLVVQEPDPNGDVTEPHRLYPPTRTQLGPEVPTNVRRFFNEAVACFEFAKSYTATALMCRRVLETIAADLGQPSKSENLAKTLKKLSDLGILDASIYQWATELRTLGNLAAHGITEKVSRPDAEDALAFTEAVLSYVYTYRRRFEAYTQRKNAKP